MSTKVRRFWILTAIYVALSGTSLSLALYEENVAERIAASRREGVLSTRARELSLRRVAGFGKAGAVLATTFYALGLGVVAAPGPIRLVAGNLAVFFGIVVLIDVSTNLLGFHAPALGRPGQAAAFSMWVYDESKGWFHSPSTLAETGIGGPDRFSVRLNALGLRGPELPLDRAEDTGRVLVFGDSYVFGVGVAEDELLTTHLARLLAPHFPSGIEVVNLGVAGYSTDQQYLLWQEIGSRLSPDVVILVVCDNDYAGNTENFAYRQYYKPYFELEDDGGLRLENVPVPRLSRAQRAKLWLGRESNVWNFVRNRNAEHPKVRSLLRKLEVDVSRPPRAPYRITAALVKSFAREVTTRGAFFLVTTTGRRGEDRTPFQNLWQLAQAGIHHWTCSPSGRRPRRNRTAPRTFAPTLEPEAHELAASSLVPYLRDHCLRPRPGRDEEIFVSLDEPSGVGKDAESQRVRHRGSQAPRGRASALRDLALTNLGHAAAV
jgi:hypothetical protein